MRLALMAVCLLATHTAANASSSEARAEGSLYASRSEVVHRLTAKPRAAIRHAKQRREVRRIVRSDVSLQPGVIRSKKTGAMTRVAAKHAPTFQRYVDALEAEGASIYYMGGIRHRKGEHCSTRHKHPCGTALDVCQDARDRVSGARNCNLPSRQRMIQLAAAVGLFEGGAWGRHPDRGHVEVPSPYQVARQSKRTRYALATVR